jgi:hypothetical protein
MPLRATAELAWINVSETRIETGSSGPVKVPAKALLGRRRNALVHFAIGSQTVPLVIAEPFRAQRL